MKRATRTHKLAVGAFVVTMAALVMVATLFFSDDLTMFKHTSRYFASFKNTAGLHVGAPLKMGGVDIGSVEGIAIDTEGSTPRILLTLIIFGPNSDLVKTDSEASLETSGMLGDKFLNLTTGSAASSPLPAGSFIKVKESVEMSMVVNQSMDIINTVGQTTAKIDAFVDSLPDGAAMKAATLDFQASAHALKSLLVALNANDSTLRVLSEPAFAAGLMKSLSGVQRASEHFEAVAMKIDSGKGTLGALVNDPALYDDMRILMGRANRSKTAKFIIKELLEESDPVPGEVKPADLP